MKLFLISQDVNTGYDTYDSAVVVAASESEARSRHPDGEVFGADDHPAHGGWKGGTWAHDPGQVKVTYLGEAVPGCHEVKSVVCASFNAG